MFDIYLPVVDLSPGLFYFQALNLSEGAATICLAITILLCRPLGALLFGMVADKLGRRKTSIYSVSGFGVVTFLTRCCRDTKRWGWVLICYWYCYALSMVFFWGGYTGAMPLAIEYAKKEKRGLSAVLPSSVSPPPMLVSTLLRC